MTEHIFVDPQWIERNNFLCENQGRCKLYKNNHYSPRSYAYIYKYWKQFIKSHLLSLSQGGYIKKIEEKKKKAQHTSEKPAKIMAQIASGHRRRLLIIAELMLLLQDSIPVGGPLLLRFSHLSTVSALTLSSTNSSSICGCRERYAFTFSSVRPARQPLPSVPVLRLYKYQSSETHIRHSHFEEQFESTELTVNETCGTH